MLRNLSMVRIVALACLTLVFAVITTQKINLHTADLGRHIKNGEIFVKEHKIPKNNYYSFTHPDAPFLNHHWGSGVVFYLVKSAVGFSGLSIFNTSLNLIAFILFFYIAWKYSRFEIAFVASLLCILLLSTRTEIRPESFSHLFMAVFFFLLWEHKNGAKFKTLYLLPFIELLWVNMHIFFFLGIFMLGVFGLGALIARDFKRFKELLVISIVCAGLTLFNPAGIRGALFPLQIFNNYGYRVLENQSVLFIDKVFDFAPSLYFKAAFILLCVSWILVVFKDRKRFLTFYPELLILSIVISYIGWIAVRNFSIFAFFALVITTINLGTLKLFKNIENYIPQLLMMWILVVFILFVRHGTFWNAKRSLMGVGLVPNNLAAANFFKENKLKGPIFNNYDNGGYLIYNLFPQEKVFTDNRPEAYPTEFFNEVYIPMQEDENKWKEYLNKYNINAIFFYRLDATPWAQTFLINRVKDSEWAPVYVDEFSIIILKRTEQNTQIIQSKEIDKRVFTVK